MFSLELENCWRGKLFGPQIAKHIVETHIAPPGFPPVPESEVSSRAIIGHWPRDPKGPEITSLPDGKQTPSGMPLWGSTLFDFFFMERVPGHAWRTAASSSRLLAWAKEVGELGHAKPEIAAAEEEANPKELFPYDMARLLKDADYLPPGINEFRDNDNRLPDGRMSATRYQTFQNRIPFHPLPERLIVHDPDNTLSVGEESKGKSGDCNTPRVYKLELMKETRDAIAMERATQPKPTLEENNIADDAHTTKPKDSSVRKVKEEEALELTMVSLPPLPPPSLLTPEVHLYINAADKLGEGNHSHVYRVAWEIPRSFVMKPYICEKCLDEKLFEKLKEEAPEAKISTDKSLDVQTEELMRHIATSHGRTGKLSTIEVTTPEVDLEFVWANLGMSETLTKSGETTVHTEYEGSVRSIDVGLKWSTPGNFCKHEEERSKAPLTFKVDVTAKLSYMDDEHLEREAQNYQKLPAHFFQHWSGYHIVWPSHDPTPALAVVPQFYGYYVPEDGQVKGGKYLSPILLMENCGTPVNIEDLTIDDRNECASLLFRMHAVGWLHNSVFPRNVLMQHGDISQWPAFRKVKDRRFRIIDFGRSVHHTKAMRETGGYQSARIVEERECKKTFKISHY